MVIGSLMRSASKASGPAHKVVMHAHKNVLATLSDITNSAKEIDPIARSLNHV
jgi:hypothetical protein